MVAAVYCAAVVLGAARFALGAEAPSSDLAPTGRVRPHDLASIHGGARVTASSYEPFKNLFPTYLIDDEPNPLGIESWQPHPRDREPWLELELPHRADVERISIRFVHTRERARQRDRYLLQCGRGAGRNFTETARLQVEDAARRLRDHSMGCDGVDHIKLTFTGDKEPALYEIDVVERAR